MILFCSIKLLMHKMFVIRIVFKEAIRGRGTVYFEWTLPGRNDNEMIFDNQ